MVASDYRDATRALALNAADPRIPPSKHFSLRLEKCHQQPKIKASSSCCRENSVSSSLVQEITDIKQDAAVKWNKEWEAAIASSTAEGVLKEISHFSDDYLSTPDDLEFLYSDLRHVQEGTAQGLRDLFDQGHFDTIWLLLGASEQRTHILEGLVKASDAPTQWGQDCRALCPEVTVSNFLVQGGKSFVDFLTRFLEVFDSSNPVLLPKNYGGNRRRICQTHGGNGYRKVSKDPKNRDPKAQRSCLKSQLSISYFVPFSLASILHDITHRNNGMTNGLDIMEKFCSIYSICKNDYEGKTSHTLRELHEDTGQGVRFMVCSTCKTKLSFEVHYYSRCVVI
ncbi:hypothetical protein DFH29DRAFT_485383 [Suillus ampliporus]|nr:hypothetical protein DFH29DRAFT_485383 [Suillus ampliporus]